MRANKMGNGGQGLTEYLILLVLVAVASIGVTQVLGKTIKAKIQTAKNHIHGQVTFE